jgi:hypothetical protein
MQRRIRPFSAMGTAIAAVAIVLSACTPIDPGPPTSSTSTTTTAPDGGNPPSISSFAASTTTGPSPLTTVFTWSISDPDPGPLTCGLDLDDDGTFEVGISNCTSSTIRSATFTSVGANPVRLRVDDGTTTVTSAPLPISVGASATDQFAITVRSDGTLTAPQLAAFDAAAARWSQVIRTGLPDVAINAPANLCGTDAPAFAGTVDDVLIDASVVAIDGPGGTLGLAGPCLTRSGGGLPALGAMQFDSADVAALQASGQLQAVILHEMGHVLGIGTLWGSLLSGAGTAATSFTGLTARGSWNAIIGGSTPSVPVENTGGPGTADSHWRESVFGNELMTGFLNTGSNPLSAVTIGSLADLGYGVDLGAADPFGVAALRAPDAPSVHLHTDLLRPVGTVG